MQVRRRMARLLGAAALAMSIGTTASADPIPQDWLNNIHTGCMNACKQQQFSAPSCETACTCVEQQTAAQLDKSEFQAMNAAETNRQPMPPALQSKVEAIQDRCAPAQ